MCASLQGCFMGDTKRRMMVMIMMMARWRIVMMTFICYLLLILNWMLLVLSYSWLISPHQKCFGKCKILGKGESNFLKEDKINFGRKLNRHIPFLKFVTTALLDKCNQDRLKIATAIGESLEQALRFKCCPAPRKFSHQNFVDYVNSVNVACKGHISGICAHQNHQNNQSSAEWEPLNMIKSVTPLLDKW